MLNNWLCKVDTDILATDKFCTLLMTRIGNVHVIFRKKN